MAKKILVVDDEHYFTDLIAVRLERNGYEVVKAYDAEEAVEVVSREKPDLILLDNMLPKGSGLGLLKTIRSSGGAMLTPVILMTAAISDDTQKKALRAGATDFIVKPIGSEELLKKIDQILEKKPSL